MSDTPKNEPVKVVDRKVANMLAALFNSMCEALAYSFDMIAVPQQWSFTPDKMELRIVFRTKSSAPNAKPDEPADFRANAAKLGLPADCFKRDFPVTDAEGTFIYTILDIKTRNRTYPVICQRSDGSRRKCGVKWVKDRLS